MKNKILYWAVGVCASLALILSIADIALVKGNQALQDEANQRQNIINTASRIQPLSKQLSQALFQIAVKDNDQNVKNLLTSQGFVLPQAPAPGQSMNKEPAPKKGDAAEAKKPSKEKGEE